MKACSKESVIGAALLSSKLILYDAVVDYNDDDDDEHRQTVSQ